MRAKCKTHRRQTGFTLIEMMVTVAIVGILLAVALPAYRDYVRRGQMPEGVSTLSDYRIKMENYYQDNNHKYGTSKCADGANAPTWSSFNATSYFTYSCSLTNSGQGYLITATGSGGQATGNVYTLDHNNSKATTQFKGAAVTKACWLLRGDEC